MKHLILAFLLLTTSCLYAQDDDNAVEVEPTQDLEEMLQEEEYVEDDLSGFVPDDSGTQHVIVKPDETKAAKQFQDEKLYHKGFDENKWREIVGENDFKQDEPDPPNFRMPSLSWAGPLVKAIGYGIIVAIVLILLWFVFKNIKYNSKVRKSGIAPFASPDEDDIHEMDLPAMLKQAMADKNFKLAVRLYFLLLLKDLHNSGMIKWEKDKTNRDYLSELFSKENVYDDVRKLTISYEEVWYGDHYFAEDSLLTLISRFESIQSKVNPGKSS